MVELSKSIKEVNSIFEQPWWLDIVAPNRWESIIIKDKNQNIIARIVFENKSKGFLKWIGVPILTQQIGPWINTDGIDKNITYLKRQKNVIEEIIDKFANKNVDLCLHSSFTYLLPFFWNGYSVEPRFSYVISSLDNLDIVYKNMEAKLRNIIKKAERTLEVDYNITNIEILNLLKHTYAKQNRKLPYSEEIIIQICDEIRYRNTGIIVGAKNNGKLVSVGVFVYDKNTCYYLLGGKDYNSNINGSQELVIWEGIKLASTVSKTFDFEGSMIKGIESFFRSFGGSPVVYYRIRRGSFIFNFLNYIKPFVKKIIGYK